MKGSGHLLCIIFLLTPQIKDDERNERYQNAHGDSTSPGSLCSSLEVHRGLEQHDPTTSPRAYHVRATPTVGVEPDEFKDRADYDPECVRRGQKFAQIHHEYGCAAKSAM